MKIRTIVLAGIAALAVSGPAVASDATGWYLGLGAGWDRLGNLSLHFLPAGPGEKANTDDAALFLGTFGYRLPSGIRFEAEIGYDHHSVNGADVLFGAGSLSGHINNLTGMLNAAYD